MAEKLCELRTKGGGGGSVKGAFCISGTSANTTYGHTASSTDTTLMDIISGANTQSYSYTVKRDAKGKVGFGFTNRGAITSYPTITLNGNNIYNGRLDDWVLSSIPLLDVTLSANDTIILTCGRSTSMTVNMYFVEV